jgi:hypothetical protein
MKEQILMQQSLCLSESTESNEPPTLLKEDPSFKSTKIFTESST